MTAGTSWRDGLDSLRRRVASLPEVIGSFASAPPLEAPDGLTSVRRIVTTGIGSSEAHARLAAHLLQDAAAPSACFRPLTAVLSSRPGTEEDALVVFSQGLSPNARLALGSSGRWRRVVVVTAADPARDDEKGHLLRALAREGAWIVRFPGEEEYGTLLRVLGPMAGYVAAAAVAEAFGASEVAARASASSVVARLRAAPGKLAAALEAAGATVEEIAEGPLAFLASGDTTELSCNVQFKILEGLLRPLPPVFDLLHFAHGPFQEAFERSGIFVALTHAGATLERNLLERLRAMLVPERQRLVVLESELAAPLSLLEHEALLNELVLGGIAARGIDQTRWPGRGRDAPLYALERLDDETVGTPAAPRRQPSERARPGVASLAEGGAAGERRRRLEDLTWPELEELLAAGCRTAVVPLGSTEQHGPHLPFAVDSWIAEELARRFCSRVAEAVQLPVLRLGCSSEHLGFPGTLDLRPHTLEAVLADLLCSLRGHGFAVAFVFSAHGGNFRALAEALPRLRSGAAPLEVLAFTDLAGLGELSHAESRREGVPAESSGHHAGEFETSIMLGLYPAAVRRAALDVGLAADVAGAQAIFYPSLRNHSASGVVGDPRGADPRRASRYLDAWAGRLVESYRREKNRVYANGTQNE